MVLLLLMLLLLLLLLPLLLLHQGSKGSLVCHELGKRAQ